MKIKTVSNALLSASEYAKGRAKRSKEQTSIDRQVMRCIAERRTGREIGTHPADTMQDEWEPSHRILDTLDLSFIVTSDPFHRDSGAGGDSFGNVVKTTETIAQPTRHQQETIDMASRVAEYRRHVAGRMPIVYRPRTR